MSSFAQTRIGLAISVAEMQQHSSVRQKSGYSGVIAIILIIVLGFSPHLENSACK
jgi:hypothetical protein